MSEKTDRETTVADLRELVRQFVAARQWERFHSPKNLAMSLAIEAAELMEHFQWLDVEQSRATRDSAEALGMVAEELADVLCYALALANELQVDVATAVRKKMLKNALKYPVEEYRGRYGPRDAREPS